MLQVANAHLRHQHGSGASIYKWRFVSLNGEAVTASNGMPLQTHKIGPRERYDAVFIPSMHYTGGRTLDQFLRQQSQACAWIRQQWMQGAHVAANCTGTFLLGQTGLLDERTATTTWWLERQFRERFPRAKLQAASLLTESDRLICAGASASSLLQAVRVIEAISGQSIAAQTAKTMLIDVSQRTQTPYLPLIAGREHGDALVSQAQHWLQRHMGQELRMADLARALCTSERTVSRRFKQALDMTPLKYLQDLRLDTARTLLEIGSQSIEQVAAQVGYSDTSSFSRLFRERTGITPGAYRRRLSGGS